MANRSLAEKHAATGRDQDGVPSVRSYRTAADAELRAYGRSVSAYERDVEQLTRRAARPVRHADERAGASRSSDTHTINRLLLEWEDDRTMAAVVGNGERPADRRRDLYRTGAPVRSSARPALEDREGVVALSAAFLTAPRQAPAILAALALAVAMMSVWFVPATPVTGLLAAPTLTLPRTGDAELALAEFSTPMSEDMLSVDTSQIDPHKFDMLTLRDYVVQPGETLSQIAARFNLRVDTIISVNDIKNPRSIKQGTLYKIPNRNGLMYKVAAADTLESVAKKYNVPVSSLLDGNNLSDAALIAGSSLFIPEARMNSLDLKELLGELFMWPTVGSFSSGFGYRKDPFTGVRMFHNGIDLAGYIGAPVRAGMEGRVVDIQSQVGNYGKMIIIKHSRGFKTLYAHLSSFNVEVGQVVSQGQIIGRMGNTGRSTGPHLHFSVFKNGQAVNPLSYLK